jgi:hypothetical protein
MEVEEGKDLCTYNHGGVPVAAVHQVKAFTALGEMPRPQVDGSFWNRNWSCNGGGCYEEGTGNGLGEEHLECWGV